MNKEILIGNYEREIANLQWHLDTNGGTGMAPEEKFRIETRISDRRQFIDDLKRL